MNAHADGAPRDRDTADAAQSAAGPRPTTTVDHAATKSTGRRASRPIAASRTEGPTRRPERWTNTHPKADNRQRDALYPDAAQAADLGFSDPIEILYDACTTSTCASGGTAETRISAAARCT